MQIAEPAIARPSEQPLTASIAKGTAFGVVSRGAQIGTRLIMIPIVISHLGLGGYGIWSIILVVAAYMRFGNAGIKSAFQKYVAEATAMGTFERASNLVSTGAISMLVISTAGLVPLAIFSRNFARFAGVPTVFLGAAASSITALGLVYAISNFGSAFESILMGGQRIDLTRIYSAFLAILEAAGIIILLHFGYGLLAMTLVMGASELVYIACCYVSSRRVLPAMKIGLAHFKLHAFPELIRYAGSYQLVNILELLYGTILPITVLKYFGADAAGILAVAGRVAGSALMVQSALVLPILSGGSLVFASRSVERLKAFLAKSFRVTLVAALPAVAFVCAFGTLFVFAWTGEAGPRFSTALWLIAIAGLFQAVSLLQLILYRAAGGALLDNIRQILRFSVILAAAYFGRRIGFTGMLAAVAGAELLGMVFMFFATARTFRAFDLRALAGDSLKMCAATALIVGAGALAGMLPVPWDMAARLAATVKLAETASGCIIGALPALLITKSVSAEEIRAIWKGLMPRRATLIPASR